MCLQTLKFLATTQYGGAQIKWNGKMYGFFHTLLVNVNFLRSTNTWMTFLIIKYFVVDQLYFIDKYFLDTPSLAPHILGNKEPCIFACW